MPNEHLDKAIFPGYLRKAWFYVLEHVKKNPDTYRKHFGKLLSDEITGFALSNDFIQTVKPAQFLFDSSGEKIFFEKGIRIAGEVHQIDFDTVYKIVKYKGQICKAISIEMEIADDLSDYLRGDKKITKEAVKKGDIVQTSIHADLSNYFISKKNPVVVTLKNATHPLSKVTASLLLRYAIGILPGLLGEKTEACKTETALLEALDHLMQNSPSGPDIEAPALEPNDNPAIAGHHAFWKIDQTSSPFENTNWLIFERTDSKRNDEAGMGIAINTFCFHELRGKHLTCEMYNKYYGPEGSEVYSYYNGIVGFGHGDNFLHIELYKNAGNLDYHHVSFMTVKLHETINQTLMVGHYTYFSHRYLKFLTKQVVWYKVTGIKCPIRPNELQAKSVYGDFLEKYVKDLNRLDDHDQFLEIPEDIRLYLHSRGLNRLTMPTIPLSFLTGGANSLEKFIKEKYHLVRRDETLTICCHSYAVCYYIGDNPVEDDSDNEQVFSQTRKDQMEIGYDENSASFQVIYRHTKTGGKTEEYKGTVSKKANSIELLMLPVKEFDTKDHTAEKDYMFITFSLPQLVHYDLATTFEKTFQFTGVITGLRDFRHTPVSYYLVLTRTELAATIDEAGELEFKEAFIQRTVGQFKLKRNQLSIKI